MMMTLLFLFLLFQHALPPSLQKPMPPHSAPLFSRTFPLQMPLSAEAAGLKPGTSVQTAFGMKVPLPPAVFSLAFSHDGKRLAAGSEGQLLLWNCETGVPDKRPGKWQGALLTLCFSPDDERLAVGGGVPGRSALAQILDLKTGNRILLEGHTDTVYCAAFSPDGTRIVTTSHDKTARIWDARSGKMQVELKGHGEAVTCAVFSPDGKSLYTGCMDRSIRRYDSTTGTLMRTLSGHEKGIHCLLPHPDGNRLVSAGEEPRLRWWNLERGEVERDDYGHSEAVTAIAMSDDKRRIATVSGDKTLKVWGEGGGFSFSEDDAQDWLYAAAFRPKSKLLASAGAEGVIRIYETENRRLRLMLMASPAADPKQTFDWLALTPQGFFTGSSGWAGTVRLLANGTPLNPAFSAGLNVSDAVQKAWKDEKLAEAKLPSLPKP